MANVLQHLVVTLALGAGLASASVAVANDDFQRVQDKSEFVNIVAGKELSILRPFYLRNAIKLEVSPQGSIAGTALRKPVVGAWRWENGYFCRDLRFGDDDIGANCQVVVVKGDEVRFIADQGQGDSADFRVLR
jgi:hypothetical protein